MDKLPIDITKSAYAVYGIPGVIGAITLLICVLLIRYLGGKFVEARFNKLAKKQDHAFTARIENIRHELGLVSDRATKVNQLEYDKLPRVWRRFTEAFLEARSETSRARSYPDVANFTDEKLKTFLEENEFHPRDIEHVLSAERRSSAIAKIYDLRGSARADAAVSRFRLSLRKYGIFIRPELLAGFVEMEALLVGAMGQWNLVLRYPEGGFKMDLVDQLYDNGLQMYRALETETRDRLWSAMVPAKSDAEEKTPPP